uniref:Uncharacterized protein n=1 Tax=Oryza nivara TaxID=4536 RepID=A0A0E0HBL9_ORYNI
MSVLSHNQLPTLVQIYARRRREGFWRLFLPDSRPATTAGSSSPVEPRPRAAAARPRPWTTADSRHPRLPNVVELVSRLHGSMAAGQCKWIV